MNSINFSSLFLSLWLHVLLLAIAFFASTEHQHYITFSPVYQVKIVEIPPVKKITKVKNKAKIGTIRKKISKKGAVKSKKVIKKAQNTKVISLKKSKTKTSWDKFLAQRIKRIEERVKERKRKEELKKEVAKVAEAVKKGISGEVIGEFAEGSFSKRALSVSFQVYYHQIWEQLKNNWILPTFLLKQAGQLEAIVILRIDQRGQIISTHFEKSSGNKIFDHSVEEAIKKSNPLPPLPKDYTSNYHEIGVRFRWSKEK